MSILKKAKLIWKTLGEFKKTVQEQTDVTQAFWAGERLGQKFRREWAAASEENKPAIKASPLPPDPLEPPASLPRTFEERGMDDMPQCMACGHTMILQGQGVSPSANGQPVGITIFTCADCGKICMSVTYQKVDKETKKLELRHLNIWTHPEEKKKYNERLAKLAAELAAEEAAQAEASEPAEEAAPDGNDPGSSN